MHLDLTGKLNFYYYRINGKNSEFLNLQVAFMWFWTDFGFS